MTFEERLKNNVAFKEIMLEQFPNLKEDVGVVEKLFKSYDQDNSGCIEFKEFVLGASKMVRGSLKDKIDTLFQIFDADGSGSVTIKELTRFVKSGSYTHTVCATNHAASS